MENCQISVQLTYAAPRGHAVIDRELHLPRSWTGDPYRRRAAAVPDDVEFATKPRLARRVIARAGHAGGLGGRRRGVWRRPNLRADLEPRSLGYALAVARDHPVTTHAGRRTAQQLTAARPPQTWQRLSAGPGAKGHRWYDWAWSAIDPTQPGHHWLLVRRNRRTKELAYYRCYSPHPVPLATLAAVAGRRWTVEDDFQAGKGLCGLDDHQLRTWTSWYRWTTLAMAAPAFSPSSP